MPIRAKTREKDTYFEAGIVQSLENRGKLNQLVDKLEFNSLPIHLFQIHQAFQRDGSPFQQDLHQYSKQKLDV